MNQSIIQHQGNTLFERGLSHAQKTARISSEHIQDIMESGATGIVSIAQRFGTPYQYTELQRAKDRMLVLINLYLQEQTGGNIDAAADIISKTPLLELSRQGSTMIKSLPHTHPKELDGYYLAVMDSNNPQGTYHGLKGNIEKNTLQDQFFQIAKNKIRQQSTSKNPENPMDIDELFLLVTFGSTNIYQVFHNYEKEKNAGYIDKWDRFVEEVAKDMKITRKALMERIADYIDGKSHLKGVTDKLFQDIKTHK